MRITYRPHKGKARKVHGFLKRMSSPGGRNIIKRRRRKERKRLTPS